MNYEKRELAFKKIKNHVKQRVGKLQFDMHPSLNRERDIHKDWHLLTSQKFTTLQSPESDVWCEKDSIDIPVQINLNEGKYKLLTVCLYF